jgi:hypothetical protein
MNYNPNHADMLFCLPYVNMTGISVFTSIVLSLQAGRPSSPV